MATTSRIIKNGYKLVNARLEEEDAALPPELKQKYPVNTLEEIQSNYPNQWVALLVTEIDRIGEIARGRVFISAADKRSLYRKKRAFRKRCPGIVRIEYFSGQWIDTGRILA